jgi:hypothetical protein
LDFQIDKKQIDKKRRAAAACISSEPLIKALAAPAARRPWAV